MFIDYAGDTIPVVDIETGRFRDAQLFIAVLGASSYTYVEAQWGQDLQSFVNGHVRTFEYFGATPELLIPDNLKSGVKKADRYEPILNRTYYEMATHYGCAILPARPRNPKDYPEDLVIPKFRKRNLIATFFSYEKCKAIG